MLRNPPFTHWHFHRSTSDEMIFFFFLRRSTVEICINASAFIYPKQSFLWVWLGSAKTAPVVSWMCCSDGVENSHLRTALSSELQSFKLSTFYTNRKANTCRHVCLPWFVSRALPKVSSRSLVTDNHPAGWHAAHCTDGNSGLAALWNRFKGKKGMGFSWQWDTVIAFTYTISIHL